MEKDLPTPPSSSSLSREGFPPVGNFGDLIASPRSHMLMRVQGGSGDPLNNP